MKTALVLAIAAVFFSSIPFFAHRGPAPTQATAQPSTSSRILTASSRNIHLGSGTQIALNVATSSTR